MLAKPPSEQQRPDPGPGGSVAMLMQTSLEPRVGWGLRDDSSG